METATGRGQRDEDSGKGRCGISCPVQAACSLVKQCVALGIYRVSSHLRLICLFAAGSCPRGVKPRGESSVAAKRTQVIPLRISAIEILCLLSSSIISSVSLIQIHLYRNGIESRQFRRARECTNHTNTSIKPASEDED